ncbi:MAG: 3-hydroxy-3-methylglutaryl-CoA reductase, partial [Bacteroidota bacterium]|nr:3-hydroxy-3-methylglutaryl-CoA reductase [Bacteroidota bacterium]
MTTSSEKVRKLLSFFGAQAPLEEIFDNVRAKQPGEVSDTIYVPAPLSWSEESRQKRIHFLRSLTNAGMGCLAGEKQADSAENLRGNIENYIGMSQVPTGVIGPLMINGTAARGYFYVPLATTEGALVASYNRGAKVCLLSGGASSVCLTDGVQRTPLFRFENLPEVGAFIQWTVQHMTEFHGIVAQNSRYAKLEEIKFNMEGNQVLLIFEYTTGDAAGQNMITLCTDAVCRYIVENASVKPKEWFVESNYSGDKKATTVSFNSVRGKKVIAEITVPRSVTEDILRTTPEKISLYWHSSSTATCLSGAIGMQGHYANGLAALFLACGQDVACVAEAAVG